MEGLRNGRKGAKGMEESQGERKETGEHGRENIGASNGANAERNVTLLELFSYMKIRFSSYKNKLKFSCH